MTEPRGRRKGRRTLLLLALVAVAPVVASYVTYYWLVPDKRVNYGELLAPGPAPTVVGERSRWRSLCVVGPAWPMGACSS